MKDKTQDPERFLPLTPAAFHVLLALAAGEKHGYAILKDIARRTENEVRLSAGTLYGIIRRLVEEGCIEESGNRPDIHLDDERRRYYRLTRFGHKVAAAEAERLEKVVAMARATKLLRPEPA